MSRIEQLIEEMCPDGVEFKELGEIAKISTGKLNANAMTLDGLYPFFTCSEKPYLIDTFAFDTEAILISGNGSQLGHINYYNGKFNAYQRTYVICEFSTNITASYLLHFLKGFLKEYIWKNVKEGSVPYITLPMLQNFQIPLPPLPIQQEIVRILDTFTALDGSLQAELEARRKQYEHYRNQLLNFEGKEVEWKTLGEISTNKNYKRIPITQSERKSGKYRYYGASGVVDYVDNYIFDGDYLLISEDGANLTARKTPIAFSVSGKFWVNNHAHVIYFENYYTRRLVEIYLNSIDLSIFITGAAQPKLNQENLYKIPIPIPPLSEQERIVGILDKFDALLNTELPAEIAARRKQYEYYREKLLTFEPLAN